LLEGGEVPLQTTRCTTVLQNKQHNRYRDAHSPLHTLDAALQLLPDSTTVTQEVWDEAGGDQGEEEEATTRESIRPQSNLNPGTVWTTLHRWVGNCVACVVQCLGPV